MGAQTQTRRQSRRNAAVEEQEYEQQSQGSSQVPATQPGSQNDNGEESSEDEHAPGQAKITLAEKYAARMEEGELERKVNDLVRLALASEHRRQPVRRDDINKKVLKEHTKAFPVVLKKAQQILRDTVGMELVELPTREKRAANTGAARRAQTAKAEPAGSKAYVLRTILPIEERETMVEWGDQAPHMILLCLILSLIYVNGRVLASDVLYNYLRHFNLSKDKSSHPHFPDLDHELAVFVKNGYLDKAKIQGTENDYYEYKWGPRAKVEFPEENVVAFMLEMYADANDSVREKLAKEIKRSAGLQLGGGVPASQT
ncbi:hypothetical protein HK102_006081 [Quaeritorhiza haematococci]|nr:hypothetical protein HK102_006081 [Quaeritorhiza haematococci]